MTYRRYGSQRAMRRACGPKDAAILAPPRQRGAPEPPYVEPKIVGRRLVHGHSVVEKVSTHNRPQPLGFKCRTEHSS